MKREASRPHSNADYTRAYSEIFFDSRVASSEIRSYLGRDTVRLRFSRCKRVLGSRSVDRYGTRDSKRLPYHRSRTNSTCGRCNSTARLAVNTLYLPEATFIRGRERRAKHANERLLDSRRTLLSFPRALLILNPSIDPLSLVP